MRARRGAATQEDGIARRDRARTTRASRRRPPRAADVRGYRDAARRQLQRFRQGSALAVALTAFLLLIWTGPVALEGQGEAQGGGSAAAEETAVVAPPSEAVEEATATITELAYSFYAYLPRILLVLLLLGVAALLSRVVRSVLRGAFGEWERLDAANAIARLVVFLLAVVASVSVLAGDARAVLGSVGLLGLAASWALQTPIESFTGWVLNSFRGYYRVGDRIAVGDVFGDVYRIDILTTTVWEAGGRGKPVAAAQPTGAFITVPNWEVLRSNIVNYSRDFPYVWDELAINVANESDLRYTARVLEDTARRVLGAEMAQAAERYEALLRDARLSFGVEEVPRVYLSSADSWTDCTIRYVVPIRTRRHWSSTLLLAVAEEVARPEHRGRILMVYPRTEVQLREHWAPPPAPGS